MSPAPDWVGRVLVDRYRVDATLGAGGMGRVYRGTDLTLARPVAIKALQGRGSPEQDARFEQEAQSVAALRHPNIVEVFDYARTEDGSPFIVMELLEGESLQERLRRAGPLPAAVSTVLVEQACSALEAAHAAGVVHRDLKPANLMLCERGGAEEVLEIIDFGIAKRTAGALATTASHANVGTPAYMSPEQAAGRSAAVDARSDVFSLGVVLYEALSGRAPFEGETPVDVMHAILHTEPPRLDEVAPRVGPDLAEVVARMMHKSRPLRYASIRDARADLLQTTFLSGAATVDGFAPPLTRSVASGEPPSGAGRTKSWPSLPMGVWLFGVVLAAAILAARFIEPSPSARPPYRAIEPAARPPAAFLGAAPSIADAQEPAWWGPVHPLGQRILQAAPRRQQVQVHGCRFDLDLDAPSLRVDERVLRLEYWGMAGGHPLRLRLTGPMDYSVELYPDDRVAVYGASGVGPCDGVGRRVTDERPPQSGR